MLFFTAESVTVLALLTEAGQEGLPLYPDLYKKAGLTVEELVRALALLEDMGLVGIFSWGYDRDGIPERMVAAVSR